MDADRYPNRGSERDGEGTGYGRFIRHPEFYPTDLAWTDSFTYKVSNGRLESNVARVDLAVNPLNRAPIIVSNPLQTATQEQLYRYVVKAVDPNPADVLTYALTTAPAGMSIDAATGLLQ